MMDDGWWSMDDGWFIMVQGGIIKQSFVCLHMVELQAPAVCGVLLDPSKSKESQTQEVWNKSVGHKSTSKCFSTWTTQHIKNTY